MNPSAPAIAASDYHVYIYIQILARLVDRHHTTSCYSLVILRAVSGAECVYNPPMPTRQKASNVRLWQDKMIPRKKGMHLACSVAQ